MLTSDERNWIECHFDKMQKQFTKVFVDIATLKVKASVWGLLGGLIPVLVLLSAGLCLYLMRGR